MANLPTLAAPAREDRHPALHDGPRSPLPGAAVSDTGFRVYMLGGFRIERGADVIALEHGEGVTDEGRQLFKWLLTRRTRRLPTDEAFDRLWPGWRETSTARGAIRRLRQALQPGVERPGQHRRLRHECRLDPARCRRLGRRRRVRAAAVRGRARRRPDRAVGAGRPPLRRRVPARRSLRGLGEPAPRGVAEPLDGAAIQPEPEPRAARRRARGGPGAPAGPGERSVRRARRPRADAAAGPARPALGGVAGLPAARREPARRA